MNKYCRNCRISEAVGLRDQRPKHPELNEKSRFARNAKRRWNLIGSSYHIRDIGTLERIGIKYEMGASHPPSFQEHRSARVI